MGKPIINQIEYPPIKYNSKDLESKFFVAERNNVVLNIYLNFIKNKKTVIFCASVKHSKDILVLLISENSAYEPIMMKAEDVIINGKVIGFMKG